MEQRLWNKERANRCSEDDSTQKTDCLMELYRHRIAELTKQVAANNPYWILICNEGKLFDKLDKNKSTKTFASAAVTIDAEQMLGELMVGARFNSQIGRRLMQDMPIISDYADGELVINA